MYSDDEEEDDEEDEETEWGNPNPFDECEPDLSDTDDSLT